MENKMPSTTAQSILDELKPLGLESYKKVLLNHGIKEPLFGVKIEYLKKIQKRIKKDYQLALDLYDTGVYDAMYLAGLIADDEKMTKKNLQHWADNANAATVCGYTVPWVAAGSHFGWEMAMKWIDSKRESIATAGWNTLSCLAALKEDAELDLKQFQQLLERVIKTIDSQADKVRLAMNAFIIGTGTYIKALTTASLTAAKKIIKVEADMGNTGCKIPDATQYINKAKDRGTIGKKKKTVKC
jgi:3-methyladenine DNA glycosylase AlkD